MGWKNIKDHYRIGHHVQVTEEGICIGSSYIHDLIVIAPDGTIKKRHDGSANADLTRYQLEMDEAPDKLRTLATTPDSFENTITVYTYRGGEIIEKVCEAPGWPNVTHDGCMMYENTYSTDRDQVVEWVKQSLDLEVRYINETIANLENRLNESRAALVSATNARDRLDAVYASIGI